jgi:preprotein translocase subunit SecA
VANDLQGRVNDATEDMVADAMAAYQAEAKKSAAHGGDAAFSHFAEALKTKFNYILPVGAFTGKEPEQVEKEITGALTKDVADKAALLGDANLNSFIRMQYLMFIDRLWLDHLENMEALREAVYLRQYGQKNPLTEYKLEGMDIFDTMIDKIRETIASRVHLVRIQLAEEREARTQNVTTQATHGSMGAFASVNAGTPHRTTQSARAGEQNQSVTVVRSHPKVGRNDPCPCGSGKKYKHCHGR